MRTHNSTRHPLDHSILGRLTMQHALPDACVKCKLYPKFCEFSLCENCWGVTQTRYHGKSQRARIDRTIYGEER